MTIHPRPNASASALRAAACVAALAFALSACDMVGSFKEGLAQSEQVAAAIEKQARVKPEVGFSIHNGSLVAVTVQFATVPAMPLDQLAALARKEALAAFHGEPDNLVISFVYRKAG